MDPSRNQLLPLRTACNNLGSLGAIKDEAEGSFSPIKLTRSLSPIYTSANSTVGGPNCL